MTEDFADQTSMHKNADDGCDNPVLDWPLLDLPYSYSREHGLLFVANDGERINIALRTGSDPLALLKIQRYLAMPIDLEIVDEDNFEKLLNENSRPLKKPGNSVLITNKMPQAIASLDDMAADIQNADGIAKESGDPFGLRLIYGIIADAARQGASTVHLESNALGMIIRVRVKGVLTEKLRLPLQLATDVIELIKQMSHLDLTDQHFPQDGFVNMPLHGNLGKVRVSSLPNVAVDGTSERIVLHILDEQITSNSLELAGMSEHIRQILTDALAQPDGLILVCGPAGSGKASTLYAGIKQLNDGTRNILTVENPIEYAVEGTGQTQIDAERSPGFAEGLRAILRQDPDVVMVSEIDDRETAEVAVEASLDGRLVLAAINSIDAVSAITRLRDMQVDPFLMASSLRIIIGQQMVRKLCEQCRKPIQAEGSLASLLGFDRGTIVFRETGCNLCNQTGFQGHIGVFEAIRIDETVRKLINNGGDEARISAHAFYNQPGLASAARTMVRQGVTTPEEGIRISRGETLAASHPGRI